jgi:uncharacterized membrane protein YfcA
MMLQLTLIYLFIGAITGVTAGLLGVGGGLIVVPALVMVFTAFDLGADHVMHFALGTSLATIIVTSVSSIVAHQKHGAIEWQDFRKLAPGLVVGSFIGALQADQLPTHALQLGFAVFVILIAVDMLLDLKSRMLSSSRKKTHSKNKSISVLAGGWIGVISALTGIGGGSMTVPYLSWKDRSIRRAIATSSACGFPIAVAASIGFVWAGYGSTGSVSGYVYLPAFIGIIVTSVLMAPVGASLAHSLPIPLIKRIFSIFLFLVGVKMIWSL